MKAVRNPAAAFAGQRPLLFRLCYRMTGSAADADDLVQETFARALERPPADLERELRPWLVRVAMNLSRDHLRKRKRQRYVGPWLPSPIETADEIDTRDPESRYGELESVSFAFLCALEALTPSQRAVLLLRDVLAYSVEETAQALKLAMGNVKTTHHRARAAMAEYDRDRAPIDAGLRARTGQALAQLLLLLRADDAAAIEAMLAASVRARNDSNGEFFAARVPITGAARVTKFHLKTSRQRAGGEPRFAIRAINGLPALLAGWDGGGPGIARRAVFRIELDREGRVRELDTIVASRKLTHVRFDAL